MSHLLVHPWSFGQMTCRDTGCHQVLQEGFRREREMERERERDREMDKGRKGKREMEMGRGKGNGTGKGKVKEGNMGWEKGKEAGYGNG